jgi:divalent metal cation (Fe/Co/Zn/Cd) transporter
VIDPGSGSASHEVLLRRGVRLEYATLAWNVLVGCVVLLAAALDAVAFALLALYITIQSAVILASGSRPGSSGAGIVWLAATVLVMLTLAAGKRRTGAALGNALLSTESRVTVIDALLAGAVLLGVALNAAAGWWWADPISALIIVPYGLRETRHAWGQARCATVAPAC